MCVSQGCTIREAVIVGSVVTKVSIPVLHGAAALVRLAAVTPDQWIPSVSHMMTVLIDKKYSLPLQVGWRSRDSRSVALTSRQGTLGLGLGRLLGIFFHLATLWTASICDSCRNAHTGSFINAVKYHNDLLAL